jgi:O-antigen ligase
MAPHNYKPYHWANSALFYYLLAVLAWAPLPLASNRDWSTQLLAGLLLAGLAWAVGLWQRGYLSVTSAASAAFPAIVALITVQVWVGLQLALGISVDPPATAQALLLGCALVSGFILVLLLLDSHHRVHLTLRLMIWCGVAQAFFAGAMMLSGIESVPLLDKTFVNNRATGTFINPNHLAGFLEMSLALGVGLLVSQLHQHPAGNWREFFQRSIDTVLGHKFRLRLFLAIMVIALVLTRSRMGNTAFFSSLLVCGALGMILQRRVTRGTVIFFVSLLLVDLYIVGSWFGVDQVVERLQNSSFEEDKRHVVAADTLAMWWDHFWLGTGADTFFQAYIYGGYKSPDSLFYRHTHNDYLEIGSGFGFIGFALLGFVVLSSLWQALMAQRERHSRLMQGLGLGATMGVVSLLIHSFADFNLHITANSLWFVVLLAFAWVARFMGKTAN